MVRYIALHDYVAESEDEISFSRGNIIIVLEQDHNDWWTGRVLGDDEGPMEEDPEYDYTGPNPIGQLPANYVEAEDVFAAEEQDASDVRLRAIHSFEGEDHDELPFEEGAVLIGKVLHQGWWTGYLEGGDGTEGMFPETYVENIGSVKYDDGTEEDSNDANEAEVRAQAAEAEAEAEAEAKKAKAEAEAKARAEAEAKARAEAEAKARAEAEAEAEAKAKAKAKAEAEAEAEAQAKTRAEAEAKAKAKAKAETEKKRLQREAERAQARGAEEERRLIQQKKKEQEELDRKKEKKRAQEEQRRKHLRQMKEKARDMEIQAQHIRELEEAKQRELEKEKRMKEAKKQNRMKIWIEKQRKLEEIKAEQTRLLKEQREEERRKRERKANLLRRDKERAMTKERRRLIDQKKKEYVEKAYAKEAKAIAKDKAEAQKELEVVRKKLKAAEAAMKMQSLGGRGKIFSEPGLSTDESITNVKKLRLATDAAQNKLKAIRKNEADRMLRAREAAEAQAFDDLADENSMRLEKERLENDKRKQEHDKMVSIRKEQDRAKRIQQVKRKNQERRRQKRKIAEGKLVNGRNKVKTELDISDAAKVAMNPRRYATRVFQSEVNIEKLGLKLESRTYNKRFGQQLPGQLTQLTPDVMNNKSARQHRMMVLHEQLKMLESLNGESTSEEFMESEESGFERIGKLRPYEGTISSNLLYSPPKPKTKKSVARRLSANQRRRQIAFQTSRPNATVLKFLPMNMRNF